MSDENENAETKDVPEELGTEQELHKSKVFVQVMSETEKSSESIQIGSILSGKGKYPSDIIKSCVKIGKDNNNGGTVMKVEPQKSEEGSREEEVKVKKEYPKPDLDFRHMMYSDVGDDATEEEMVKWGLLTPDNIAPKYDFDGLTVIRNRAMATSIYLRFNCDFSHAEVKMAKVQSAYNEADNCVFKHVKLPIDANNCQKLRFLCDVLLDTQSQRWELLSPAMTKYFHDVLKENRIKVIGFETEGVSGKRGRYNRVTSVTFGFYVTQQNGEWVIRENNNTRQSAEDSLSIQDEFPVEN